MSLFKNINQMQFSLLLAAEAMRKNAFTVDEILEHFQNKYAIKVSIEDQEGGQRTFARAIQTVNDVDIFLFISGPYKTEDEAKFDMVTKVAKYLINGFHEV